MYLLSDDLINLTRISFLFVFDVSCASQLSDAKLTYSPDTLHSEKFLNRFQPPMNLIYIFKFNSLHGFTRIWCKYCLGECCVKDTFCAFAHQFVVKNQFFCCCVRIHVVYLPSWYSRMNVARRYSWLYRHSEQHKQITLEAI